MKYIKPIGFCVVLSMVFAQAVQPGQKGTGAVSGRMHYQGWLTDTLGIPITDSLDMVFSIYDDTLGRNELWSETQTDVPVENGIFNVTLGSNNPIPDSIFSLKFDKPYCLGIMIGGQEILPKQELASVAYALNAADAFHADTAEYAKDSKNDSDWVRTADNMHSGVSGNVGIGTSSPGSKFSVRESGAYVDLADFEGYSTETARLEIMAGELESPSVAYIALEAGGSTSDILTLQPIDGYVGIGHSHPVYKLEVYDADEPVVGRFANFHDTWTDVVIESYNGTGQPSLSFKRLDLTLGHVYAGSDSIMRVVGQYGLRFNVIALGAEPMVIDNEGDVGIGTTTPERPLHVNDVLRLEPTSQPSSPSEGDIYMDSTTHKLMVYDGTTWQACW